MSTNWVRTGVVSLIACLAMGACDDNPVNEGRGDATSLGVNPDYAVVNAADTTRIYVVALDRYGELTYGGVQYTSCDNKITVAPDPERVGIEAPERTLVLGNTLGESCVIASGPSGLSDTATVVVEAARLTVTSAPDTLRAGENGEVVVTTVAKDGTPVGPFARSDAVYSSDNEDIVTVTDDIGSVATSQSGGAAITAVWTGLSGLTRQTSHSILVMPNVPTSAAFESSVFPGMVVDDVTELEVIVSDALGNKNMLEGEILGITAQSSNPAAVGVEARFVESTDPTGRVDSVNVYVRATALAGGSADVTGTVSTSEGDLAFGPAIAWVGPPTIGSITPASGAPGAAAAIAGNLAPAGFELEVWVGGLELGNAVATSPSLADVEMPVFAAAGSYDVQVLVGGVESAVTAGGWTQVGVFDEAASEPNDDPDAGLEAATVIPLEFEGSFGGGDVDDFFRFTLSKDATIIIDLDWNNDKDLDILVANGEYTDWECTDGATGAKPEQSTCELSAGEYLLLLEDYDAVGGDLSPVTYTVKAVIQ